MVLTELLDLLKGEGIARKVQPWVDKHGAVTAGKDEAIPVKPLWVIRVVLEELAPEDSTNLRATEGKTQVTGVSSADGIHGQASGLSGDLFVCIQVGKV